MVSDGDAAYYRVDTRLPAHELPLGTLADAKNKMLPDGKAWPRWAVNQQAWGQTNPNMVAGGYFVVFPSGGSACWPVNGFIVGRSYLYIPGNDTGLNTAEPNPAGVVVGQYVPAGVFVAKQAAYYLTVPNNLPPPGPGLIKVPATAQIYLVLNNCGYARFEDPDGFDTGVLLSDDWRDLAGEDGGRGRAWRILPGNGPQAIPMNGNDIYGTARLIPCLQGIVMLRQDLELHYFSAAAVSGTAGSANVTANSIQLNCAPDWVDGDQVILWADPTVQPAGSAFMGAPGENVPINGSYWHVKAVAGNKVELFADQALTQRAGWTAGAVGRFYLENRSTTPGYYGNGAPPLMAFPDLDGNPWYIAGFSAVPEQIFATALTGGTNVLTCLNHNFTPGQAVKYWSVSGKAFTGTAVVPIYVYVVDSNHIQLFTVQSDALAGAGASQLTSAGAPLSVWADTDYVVNASASGQPMPPGREGGFIGQRLVVVNGLNNIVISDPNDPLHYTLLNGLTANVGTGGKTMAVAGLSSDDTLMILNQNSILALYYFGEGSANWVLREITREYGCVAPLSVLTVGVNLMFLSRRGYDRVIDTAFGVIQPVARPVSFDMDKYVKLVYWTNAALATAAQVDNRLLLALPQKGQVAPVQNNVVWSLNLLNSDPDKDAWAWEGVWSGQYLLPYAFCNLSVFGKEWITFADYNGNVNWLSDGWLDLGLNQIPDSMTTRRYTGNEAQLKSARKIWKRALVTWDTNNPNLTVSALAPGYNEVKVIAPSPITYDRTQYAAGEGPDYDPATQEPAFGAPYREDYSLAGPGELIGGVPDVHQNITETFYPRLDAWGMQLVIANTQGSARIGQVEVWGVPGPRASSRHV